LTPASYAADSDSYEYYIKDFRVEVVANSDRSYDVTETITVYFNVESRGIFRDIQTRSSAERYRVENINVEGAPFVITEKSDYINVRIGDPDVWITGEKIYTITYTRLQYDDGEPDFDYFYMDLIGDKWDVPILNFSATVKLPDTAEIINYTITSGPSGSTDNIYAAGAVSGNVIDISMKKPLGPFMAVTLNVEMPQGTFYDAVVYAKPIVFHSIDVSAELDEYGVMTLTEVYDATINKAANIWHPAVYTDGVSSGKWIGPDGDDRNSFSPGFLDDHVGERIQFSYAYQIKFGITEFDSSHNFRIQMFSDNSDISVEKYTVSVVSPFEIYGVVFTDNYSERDPDAYTLTISNDGKQLFVEADAVPDAYYARVYFNSSGFKRAVTAGDFAVPIVAGIVAFLIYLFAFVRKPERKLVSPIEFYPPFDMNPAELGYIIDGKISNRDVTSLIYFWASHGHLSIEITDKSGGFTLHKISVPDSAHRSYETEMFEKLFAHGTDDKVTNENLQDMFSGTIYKTTREVKKSFTGDRSLDKIKHSAGLAALLIGVGYAFLFSVFSMLWVYTDDDTLYGGFFLGLLLYIAVSVLMSNYHRYKYKNPASNKVLAAISIILFAGFAYVIFMLAAGKSLTFVSTAITVASFAVMVFSVPFLNRKSDYGLTLLERIIGFKVFLQTAERSRLEMLLEQNPDYYYNILPYAQILGVSRIWEKKFDGLLRQPPTWCYGDGYVDTMRTYDLSKVTRSLSSSMTSSPSSSGGGGYSGGGGGFSGGGSPGGGGGGGGGRW